MFKKISLSLLCAVSMLAISIPNASASASNATVSSPAENNGLKEYQKAATALYSSFEMNEKGDFIFPDTFAGAMVKDNILIINITTDDTSNASAAFYHTMANDKERRQK